MSSILTAFDKHISTKKLGENGHIEHNWSADYKQQITQFFFQLVRTKDTSDLEKKLVNMLTNMRWETHTTELTILYKLIGQTRDIIDGKGEMDLTWMQLEVWSRFSIELSFKAFVYIVESKHKDLNGHQYGSWKDIKYFLAYLKNKSNESHPLVNMILLNIVVPNLKKDENLLKQGLPVSLLGRWIPREKSSKKFNWIFHKLAKMMYPEFIVEPQGGWTNRKQLIGAYSKQKIYLKKLIVKLSGSNGGSDTPQVKMAGNQWDKLNFNNVTSVTIRNQKIAILNKTKKGQTRSTDVDRIACANNYTEHIQKVLSGDKTTKIHGKRLNVGQLVKDGYSFQERSDDENDTLRQTINLQWASQAENNKGLENVPIIAMCDTSSSMECDEGTPLNNAIGLSIRISELCHPAFRNRILTWDAIPKWINLSDCKDFVEKAQKVKKSTWSTNTDFHLALDKIINTLVENDTNPDSVKKLILAVFSDMQFDTSYHNGNIFDDAYLQIKQRFAEAGMKTSHCRPYETPHILFWNLRKTKGFPSTTITKNVTFLSGYSSVLLNTFITKGLSALREVSPFTMLIDLLNNNRYKPLVENLLQHVLVYN
tara:strand:+ start:988 stop:2772 length:1785 start_codon:yes stop_codon:yes gene_type:complete